MNRLWLGMLGLVVAIGLVGCPGETPTTITATPTTTTTTAFNADIKTVSTGEKLTLKDHLVSGKYTIFEVGADW